MLALDKVGENLPPYNPLGLWDILSLVRFFNFVKETQLGFSRDDFSTSMYM